MQTVILNSKSKSDLKLLIDLAKKIGVDTKVLSEAEIEDIGIAYAIREGRTKKYIDADDFIRKLRN